MKKSALVPVKSLFLDIAAGSQSVNFVELLSGWGQRLRISIKSDSYLVQSYARIEVWSAAELKWNLVAYVQHGSMLTPAGLIYNPNRSGFQASHFQADRTELIRLAGLVLGPVA